MRVQNQAVICVCSSKAAEQVSGDEVTCMCSLGGSPLGYPRVTRASCASGAVRCLTLIWWQWSGGSATGARRSAPFAGLKNLAKLGLSQPRLYVISIWIKWVCQVSKNLMWHLINWGKRWKCEETESKQETTASLLSRTYSSSSRFYAADRDLTASLAASAKTKLAASALSGAPWLPRPGSPRPHNTLRLTTPAAELKRGRPAPLPALQTSSTSAVGSRTCRSRTLPYSIPSPPLFLSCPPVCSLILLLQSPGLPHACSPGLARALTVAIHPASRTR
jgi:hypothetical protein